MADNVYLLETRLSKAQQAALAAVREVARARGLTVFLVGGAVRDLIGGTAVRDLDVVVQGNALKLKKDIEKAGGVIAGEMEPGQAFFVRFPGGVRMEIGSTLTVTYPKPGKAVVRPATILEDLRRRDFTANAMALSLNEGSYGLLMDPLNGVADIENRELRLVSNYGFIEDPVRMIRAARLMARLGWGLEEKTQTRYETGKAEGYISAMDEFHRGYETEEIFHEEDPLRVIRRLEEEGWMQHLASALSAARANVGELERLRESQAQLQMQGIAADAATASFPYITAKMTPGEVQALKKSFPRQGFVGEIEALDARGKEFAAQLGTKGAALPSQAYKLIVSSEPEAVLWAAHTTKNAALQAKFKSFYTDWQQSRQRIPYLQMQEMRITPDLHEYDGLVDKLFFELMDGRLGTVEEMKAYLEPYSPPAPPPPVSLRRPRAPKKEAKPGKSRKKVAEAPEDAAIQEGEAAQGAPVSEEAGVAAAAIPPGISAPSPSSPTQRVAPKVEPKGERPANAEPAAKSPGTAVKGASKVVAPRSNGTDKVTAKLIQKTGRAAAPGHAPAKGSGGASVAAGAAGRSRPQKTAAGSGTKSIPASSKKSSTAKKVVPAKKTAPAKKAAPLKAVKKGTPPAASKSAKKGARARPGTGAKASVKRLPTKPAAKQTASKGSSSQGKKAAAKKRR